MEPTSRGDLKVAHGRVWRWRPQQQLEDGRTGTHERLWTWQQDMRRGVQGPMADLRAWQQQWEARNLPAPYDKMEPTSSVRRPESGTWQSVAKETAAKGAVLRDP
ncbi:unnamed protein product [Staurois parvus]|uniref:Uncharacterized protein n=1 Tax=Staurois parvus TaxID=386267 RepID=A0ABN9D4S0_9NEOB|nr:unnamed protein product [Staurois parvus]